jgi:hypothetical protein
VSDGERGETARRSQHARLDALHDVIHVVIVTRALHSVCVCVRE